MVRIRSKKNTMWRNSILSSILACFVTLACSAVALGAANEVSHEKGNSINKVGKVVKMKKIVLIGASYAEAWPLKTLGEYSVINKGVGGEQSHQVLARFQKDAVDQNPEKVIIWGFINDIHNSERSALEEKLARTKENIMEMVGMALNNNIVPILATEVTIRHKDTLKSNIMNFVGTILGKKSYQQFVNEKVLETNDWLKAYAKEQNILLLHLQPLIADENNYRIKKHATPDGTHISEEAYEIFTEYVKKKL